MGWEIWHAVSFQGDCLEALGRGATGSRDPGPANGHLRGIQGVRNFYHVCIVFISPPEVDLRVLSLYFACFVHVLMLFIDDTYCIHIAFSAPTCEETHAGCQCSGQ